MRSNKACFKPVLIRKSRNTAKRHLPDSAYSALKPLNVVKVVNPVINGGKSKVPL